MLAAILCAGLHTVQLFPFSCVPVGTESQLALIVSGRNAWFCVCSSPSPDAPGFAHRCMKMVARVQKARRPGPRLPAGPWVLVCGQGGRSLCLPLE